MASVSVVCGGWEEVDVDVENEFDGSKFAMLIYCFSFGTRSRC